MKISLSVGVTPLEARSMPEQLWTACADTDDGSPLFDACGPDGLTAVMRLAEALAEAWEAEQ